MQTDGYGGRAGNHQNETLEVLAGLLPEDWSDKALLSWGAFRNLPVTNCANPKCGRLFQPRAEGDDYCNERCDPLNKFKGIELRNED
jgi:hypothetical protein